MANLMGMKVRHPSSGNSDVMKAVMCHVSLVVINQYQLINTVVEFLPVKFIEIASCTVHNYGQVYP